MAIQLATVESLSYIFNKKWLFENGSADEDFSLKDFHVELFEKMEMERMIVQTEDDEDTNTRKESVRIQFYGAVIANNYILRKRCLFLLAEFAYENNLGRGMILDCNRPID